MTSGSWQRGMLLVKPPSQQRWGGREGGRGRGRVRGRGRGREGGMEERREGRKGKGVRK